MESTQVLSFNEDGWPSHFDCNLFLSADRDEPWVNMYPYDPVRGVTLWNRDLAGFSATLPENFFWSDALDVGVDEYDGVWYSERDLPDWLEKQIRHNRETQREMGD